MTTNTPVWQEAIRQAQITQQTLNEAAEEKKRAEKAKEDAEHGRNLARVLDVAFGIKVEPPLKNEVVLDGYMFWLKTNMHYSQYDRDPLFCEEVVKAKNMPDWTRFSFTMYVSILRPDDVLSDEWENWPRAQVFTATNDSVEQNWTKMRYHLANALDELRRDADREIESYKRQLRKSSIEMKSPPKPTFEDVLRSLLHEMVKEAVEAQHADVDY